MSENSKKTIWVLAILIIVVSIYLIYKMKTDEFKVGSGTSSEAIVDNSALMGEEDMTAGGTPADEVVNEDENVEDFDFNSVCEAGQWVEIASASGATEKFTGKLRRVYPNDAASKGFENFKFFLEGTARTGLAGDNLMKLDYFENRDVEIEGVKSATAVTASKVRCSGSETDADLITQRKKILDYVAANINSFAPKKAPHQKWTVDAVDFIDLKNIYVDYYDSIEDDEDEEIEDDTSRRVLVALTASGSSFAARVNAYWEAGEDDYVLKEGKDEFEAVEDVVSYEYDPELKSWERID